MQEALERKIPQTKVTGLVEDITCFFVQLWNSTAYMCLDKDHHEFNDAQQAHHLFEQQSRNTGIDI
jgi:hypothetical protein